MNLILLHKDDLIGDRRVRLTGRRLRHVTEVHRAGVGDSLRVGLINDLIGTGSVTSVSGESLEMEVALTEKPPAALPLTLVLALPRPKVLRRVISSVSSLGVKKIILINSYRVEKSYWQSPFLSEEVLRDQMVLGLEQAVDTVMPEVSLKPLFRPFVEDELPAIIQGRTALVAHPAAGDPCPLSPAGQIVLAIGPEGGFIQYEIDKLASCGFRPVSLGTRILRVETAVPYIISRLSV